MGKYLFSVLSILLLTIVLSLRVFASSGHEISGIDLVKNENEYRAKVNMKLSPQSETFTSALFLQSLKLAQGFQKATVNNVDQVCRVDGGKVICNHEKNATNLIYEFLWQPQEVIENEYCASVTLEKQKNIDEANNYTLKFVTAAQNAYPFVHKIVIKEVTTLGNLSETYADFTSDKSFTILWGRDVLPSLEKQIAEVSFTKENSFDKISKGAYTNGQSYRPFAGSLSSFEAQEQYKIYFINTKKNSLNVESANLVLCKEDNIKVEKFTVNFLHEIYTHETLTSNSPTSRNLIISWDEIIYDAEITPTITSTPTNVPTITSTPTPQPTIVVSASSSPNTPIPTPNSSQSSGVSSQIDTAAIPTNTIFNYGDEGDIESNPKKENDGIDILGESTNRANTKQKSVILSLPKDPLFEYANNTTIRIVFTTMLVFLAASCYLILSLKLTIKSSTTRDLSQHKADRVDITKRGITAQIFASFKKLLSIFVFVVLVFVFARPAAAQSAPTSIKITDAFKMHGTGAYTGVMNIIYTYVTKPSTSGKFVISKNPDGTGDIEIGNYLQAQVKNIYYASVKSYWVGPADGSGKHYICPDITTLSPQDVSGWFPSVGATYQITFRFITSCQKDFPVSDLYFVFVPDPTPTPSATPTSTQTPTPTPFAPFLDLPWDYRSKGLSFNSAATAMTSYFDHEYPLLSQGVVGFYDSSNTVITFENLNRNSKINYSSHDGYDYAKASKANYGDPQLAAAGGIATLHKDFWQQGNAIYIDHRNRFQTRYYHLDHKDLLTSETGENVDVKQGQMIGRIGFTGKTDPKGEGGAHIHFMVVYDKNHDGNFDDNIPDGLIDPYGWMGADGADPWENAVFQYPYGTSRTGMRSSYLWKYQLTDTKMDIGPDGGELAGEGIKIQIPRITLDQILNFHMKAVPRPKDPQSTDSAKLEIISPVTDITAKDVGGQYVRYFNNPFNIIIDLTTDVAKYYKPGSVSIYSSSDGGDTWQKEPTIIDLENNKAIGTPDHLTLFTVMGEKKDNLPPTTSIAVTGLGKNGKFRSDAQMSLDISDDADSLGIDYTLFTLDSDTDWQEYTNAINIASEGAHMIKAFSVDKSGNIESTNMLEFVIDKTAPEISMRYATGSGKFEFVNAEQGTLRQAQGDNTISTIAEDVAGNTNELRHETKNYEGLTTLRIINVVENGETINYKPSIYAINTSETGTAYEYLSSGEDTTRVITAENGEVLMIKNDEIEEYSGERPLQLKTEGDRLVLVNIEQL